MPRLGQRMRFGIVCGFAGLWLAWGVSTSLGADGGHASRWIAGDAAIYLELSHASPLLDQLLSDKYQNALTALPGYVQTTRSKTYKQAIAELEHVSKQLGTTWQQGLRDLTGGGIVLAVEGEPGKSARPILIVTPTDPAFLTRTNQTILDRAREKANSQGKADPIQSTDYRGITGYEPGHGAYAIVEGKLVIVDRLKTLQQVIDRVLDGAEAGASLADDATWKARREQAGDRQAWGLVRLDRLRELDPKRFAFKGDPKLPATFLFGSWLEVIRKADWASAALSWTDAGLAAELTLPTPPSGYPDALKGFVPPQGRGATQPVNPPGTIASLSLWRDLASVWEARADLFPPEVVQGLAKLDGVAGQFFGARDFGTDVLGALGDEWRLVIARQDHSSLKPVPDMKLPAFALVVDLKPGDNDFPQRLKVAFQSIVGLINLGGVQSKSPPLELGSETVADVTISTARYMLPKTPADAKEPVHSRHNFSPAIAQVENRFILSSSVSLARDLIQTFKTPAKPEDRTLMVEANGRELADLVEINKSRLVMQNMLEKGHNKTQAEHEISVLTQLLRYLGLARLSVQDSAEVVRLKLNLDLAN
ncbi:hypothetical protein SAMN05444166_2870 [Singulisphaera sp. GP187]|uniref:DUF3352 domain-containing protein n=1 Tax=Singulisphaera sp. GP187 TaxID=1882752 RepID=UPI00092BA6C1|nr:DUF3352 domain-containing protein [Singulisphaera sp. GP187]SIO18397.1 hypothetical protein SAMN05444166_2870 [Singulisphaera sp. GP187]